MKMRRPDDNVTPDEITAGRAIMTRLLEAADLGRLSTLAPHAKCLILTALYRVGMEPPSKSLESIDSSICRRLLEADIRQLLAYDYATLFARDRWLDGKDELAQMLALEQIRLDHGDVTVPPLIAVPCDWSVTSSRKGGTERKRGWTFQGSDKP